jgi:hypothetical protein
MANTGNSIPGEEDKLSCLISSTREHHNPLVFDSFQDALKFLALGRPPGSSSRTQEHYVYGLTFPGVDSLWHISSTPLTPGTYVSYSYRGSLVGFW